MCEQFDIVNVRGLKLWPPVALAPMVGLSHSAVRSLLQEIGGVGIFFSEMLSAKRVPHENERCVPALIRAPEERPLFYQIFANENTDIEAAVTKLERLNAQGIDLNLGCPAPQLRRIGAGKYLFQRADACSLVLKRLRDATRLPISVKIRIGETADSMVLCDRCAKLEQSGVDLITVHARLNDEKFCRRPRWDLLAPVVRRISIPVFANGGIFSVADARDCLDKSRAAGIMIGRGAICNLGLIGAIAREIFHSETPLADWSNEELYFKFVALLADRFPVEKQLGRLKQFTHLYAVSEPFGHRLASMVQGSRTMEEAAGRAAAFFNGHG